MALINPFTEKRRSEAKDKELVARAVKGDRIAMENLVKRHQGWIYNIALRMTAHPQDAEDITQEVLVKVITHLSTFKGQSSLTTWLYRIVANHVINMKKKSYEKFELNFEEYGELIDNTPHRPLPSQNSMPAEIPLLVEETRIGCIMGMLLCLEREQRLVFILGAILNVNARIGSEIMDISRDNFRQKLSRSRRRVANFMNEKCGLVNKNNPCHCKKLTKALIDNGTVDPNHLIFCSVGLRKVKAIARTKIQNIDNFYEKKCSQIFRDDPFYKSPDFAVNLRNIIDSDEFKNIMNLDA